MIRNANSRRHRPGIARIVVAMLGFLLVAFAAGALAILRGPR